MKVARYAAGLFVLLLGCNDVPTPRRSAAVPDSGHAPGPSCGALRPTHGALCGVAYPRAELANAVALDAAVSATDASNPQPPPDPVRARGEYLVRHVAGCMECHTPRLASGAFDEGKLLSGVEQLADLEPDDDARGAVHSRNLTPDPMTGLGMWTDDQIKKAFQEGIDDQGKTLSWMMPYWIFHDMKPADADAVVAFLRSIAAIEHEIPENQPLSVALDQPYQLPQAVIPETSLAPSHADYDSAERGRYLATSVAPCILCHTPVVAADVSVPIDASRLFGGRRKWAPVRLGVAVDKGAPLIDSFNLTPDKNGIGAFSAQDVANTLRIGIGRSGLPVCDPMPSSMFGSFLGMDEQDALDIGHYLTTIRPVDSGVIEVCCSACHKRVAADAGGL